MKKSNPEADVGYIVFKESKDGDYTGKAEDYAGKLPIGAEPTHLPFECDFSTFSRSTTFRSADLRFILTPGGGLRQKVSDAAETAAIAPNLLHRTSLARLAELIGA